jgi:hypothetical protein
MHLVQVLLPLYDNAGHPYPKVLYAEVRDAFITRFGGLTAYTRAPATGLWQEDEARTVRDDLVIYEVMVNRLDEQWWHLHRKALEARFRQEAIVIRTHKVRLL